MRGIHPPVLADRGLADAVRALALDSPLRVQVTGHAARAAAGAGGVGRATSRSASCSPTWPSTRARGAAEVDLRHESGALRVIVRDDGAGGADPSRGTGLRGIARRLAAFDGVLVVVQPGRRPDRGDHLEVPCALS